VFAQAVREGRIDRNPAKEVERLAPPKRETYLPNEAYSRIMAKLPAEWMVRACDLIYLLSERPSDVLGLQDRNVDWDVPSVWLEQSKTGQPIEIVMNEDLAETLRWFKDWKKSQGIASPYLVCTPKSHRGGPGRRVRAEYLSKAFAQAVKEAGYQAGEYKLKDLRPKSLTDEFVEAGDSEKGGHRTERMKRYYRRGQLPMRARTNVKRVTNDG
jgi:integrase